MRFYLSFDAVDEAKVDESIDYVENIDRENRPFVKSGLLNSNVIFFFLTKCFIKTRLTRPLLTCQFFFCFLGAVYHLLVLISLFTRENNNLIKKNENQQQIKSLFVQVL